MTQKPVPHGVAFLVCLAACYAPGVLFFHGVQEFGLRFLHFFPLLLLLVVAEIHSPEFALGLLSLFLLGILILSGYWGRSRAMLFLLANIVLVASVMQAVIGLALLRLPF